MNETFAQMNLIDSYKVFYPTIEYIFLSAVHGNLSKVDNVLANKVCSSKLEKTKIISGILSVHSNETRTQWQKLPIHSALKLELNIKRNYRNYAIHGN